MSEDSHLTRAGATIAYQFTGSGSPAGYAHGVTLSRDAVRRLDLLDIDALAERHQLLSYDQRGHGRSTGRPVTEDYRFENYTQDLLALIDTLGIDQPMDFAGSSLGTDTALRAALAAPHRFRRLALLIPPVAWETGPRQARQWYFDTADSIERLGAAAWREQAAHADPLPIFADYPEFDMTPDVADELLPHVLRGAGQSDLPAPEAIATLRHPTLILAWDTDPLHPVATAERLHELLPHSTLHVATSVADIKGWTGLITDFFTD
ncbi:alpha/beta fold hydrolase [Goodfellowiella coeruleoviolacea]|uniref:Pimeloyl-ACP methyl ester carboxylesterase n=1 Tax=Goodfellowiella coeruleoviolacea TaxID=334858 RepID=A0AAE3GGN2_9PSEU|nr:alpha/beta hydrolase [Goodfellowiella coeruleoviolacea]MCP2167037.1 Pimeloyl-ACP methyl ester carboxylesterase [Goodfellowiella coeruleoviolacea]